MPNVMQVLPIKMKTLWKNSVSHKSAKDDTSLISQELFLITVNILKLSWPTTTKVTLISRFLFPNSKLIQSMCTANIWFPDCFPKFVSGSSVWSMVALYKNLRISVLEKKYVYSFTWNNMKTTYEIMFGKQWYQAMRAVIPVRWESFVRDLREILKCPKREKSRRKLADSLVEKIELRFWRIKGIYKSQDHGPQRRELSTWRLSQNLKICETSF